MQTHQLLVDGVHALFQTDILGLLMLLGLRNALALALHRLHSLLQIGDLLLADCDELS